MKKTLILAICLSLLSWSCDSVYFGPQCGDSNDPMDFVLLQTPQFLKVEEESIDPEEEQVTAIAVNEYILKFKIQGENLNSKDYKMGFQLLTASAYACSPYFQKYVEPIKSIDITSDQNFNDKYPAGSSLKDLLAVWPNAFDSAKPVSSFIKDQPTRTFTNISDGLSKKEEFVDNYDGLTYELSFIAQPAKTLKHQFTLKVSFSSGKEIQTTFTRTIEGLSL